MTHSPGYKAQENAGLQSFHIAAHAVFLLPGIQILQAGAGACKHLDTDATSTSGPLSSEATNPPSFGAVQRSPTLLRM